MVAIRLKKHIRVLFGPDDEQLMFIAELFLKLTKSVIQHPDINNIDYVSSIRDNYREFNNILNSLEAAVNLRVRAELIWHALDRLSTVVDKVAAIRK